MFKILEILTRNVQKNCAAPTLNYGNGDCFLLNSYFLSLKIKQTTKSLNIDPL